MGGGFRPIYRKAGVEPRSVQVILLRSSYLITRGGHLDQQPSEGAEGGQL